MTAAARKMADSLRASAVRREERRGPGRYRATVTRWGGPDDFSLDLHGADLELDEEDVTLGQTVLRYDADTGIAPDDALILVEVGEGDFVAVEVESDGELDDSMLRGAHRNLDAFNNIAIGAAPEFVTPTAHDNTMLGAGAGASYETGAGNVGIGHDALRNDVDGIGNTAVGQQALKNHQSGNDNTAIGTGVLYNSIDSQANTGVGEQVLFHQQHGNYNVAVGTGCLFSFTDSAAGGDPDRGILPGTIANNVAIGHNSLHDLDRGYNNVGVGGGTMENLVGDNAVLNTAVGVNALLDLVTGYDNTALGASAGASLVTGQRNTFLGQAAGDSDGTTATATTVANATCIGYGAQTLVSNAMVFGSEIPLYRPNYIFGAVGRAAAFGGGSGVIAIAPARINPSSNPVGAGLLYVDAATSELKYRGPSGTVTTLGPA